MFDNIQPYKLRLIQTDCPSRKNIERKKSDFEKCFIYKFFTDENTKGGKTRYIARAEVYGECIAVKFYPQSADEDHRYSSSTNRFTFKGVLQIVLSCASLIPEMVKRFPDASFVIKASESVDMQTKTEEQEYNNQRFRIYKYALSRVIGNETFEHYEYPNVSIYFLINKRGGEDLDLKRERIKQELVDRFNLSDL